MRRLISSRVVRAASCAALVLFAVGCGDGGDPLDSGDPSKDPNPHNPPQDTDQPPPGLQCNSPFSTPAPGGEGSGSCVTEVISCGEVIRATNEGGSYAFDSAPGGPFSQCAGSASQTTRLDGPERVYELVYPPGTRALNAYLKSCEESWLFWFQAEDTCPDYILSCGHAFKGTAYDQHAEILLAEYDRIYFVVEGERGRAGNFELRVDCFD